MPRRIRRAELLWTVVLSILVVTILLAATAQAATALTPNPVTAAWQQAKAAGSYRFSSEIIQQTTPLPTVTNAGRSGQEQRMRLEGTADPAAQMLELTLWLNGGSAGDRESGVALRVEGDRTFMRQPGGEWQPAPAVLNGAAPQGDLLIYLAAVRDVTMIGQETRAGRDFTRYGFQIDGPALAAQLARAAEDYAHSKGELPAGVRLDAGSTFAQATGSGELWVRPDGLPLRQILHLSFPPEGDEQASARIVIDFSGFEVPPAGLDPLGWLRDLDLAALLSLTLSVAVLGLVVRFRHSRHVAAGMAVVIILSLVAGPLLGALELRSFLDARAAQAAEQDAQRQQAAATEELIDAVRGPAFDPTRNPLQAAPAAAPSVQADTGADSDGDGLSDAEEVELGTNPNQRDSDGDGLSDFQEERLLGTNPLDVDTDSDEVSDLVEVTPSSFAGVQWYSDPLEPDTNRDGIPDGAERLFDSADQDDLPDDANNDGLPDLVDTDSDGTPDAFDADNDNDGVPDLDDLAPGVAMPDASMFYGENNPLALRVNGLESGKPTYLDFQLRPQNDDNLWFAYNVFDWPQGDNAGQIQDGDGATFADRSRSLGLTGEPAEANGDLRLLPSLEIEFSGANPPLPYTTTITQALRFDGTITGEVRLFQATNAISVVLDLEQVGPYDVSIFNGSCASRGSGMLSPTTIPGPSGQFSFNPGRTLLSIADGGAAVQLRAPALTSGGDLRIECVDLRPMLNGPHDDRVVNTAALEPYNISVIERVNPMPGASGNLLVAYVPAAVASDRQNSTRIAFNARLFLTPNDSPVTARVRLAWNVQALLDSCLQTRNGICTQPGERNLPRYVMTYYDNWKLAGMTLREDHGATVGVTYEDPTGIDPDPLDDGPLWALSGVFDELLLLARDEAPLDRRRDYTLGLLAQRFDRDNNDAFSDAERFGLPDLFQMELYKYSHFDQAVAETSRQVASLLPRFNSAWASNANLRPLFLFTREETGRYLGLDDPGLDGNYVSRGSELVFDLNPDGAQPAPQLTRASMRWQPYCAASGISTPNWTPCQIDDYWAELERRHLATATLPGDSPGDNLDLRRGRVFVAQTYFSALSNGVNALVAVNDVPVPPPGPVTPVANLPFFAIKTIPFVDERALNRDALKVDADRIYKYLGVKVDPSFKQDGPLVRLATGGKDPNTQLKKLAEKSFEEAELTPQKGGKVGRKLAVGKTVLGVLLSAAAFGVNTGTADRRSETDAIAGRATIFAVNFAIITAIPFVDQILQFRQMVNLLRTPPATSGITALSTSQALRKVATTKAAVSGATRLGGAVGMALNISATWISVGIATASSGADLDSFALNMLIADAIAQTLLAVLLFVLSATVIGSLLVSLVSLIDTLLVGLCESGVEDLRDVPGMNGACFSVGALITKQIGAMIYSYVPLIDTERDGLVLIGGFDARLADPTRGFISGNPITLTVPVTTTVFGLKPTGYDQLKLSFYANTFFTEQAIRSTTFKHEISRAPVELSAELDEMAPAWDVSRAEDNPVFDIYRAQRRSPHPSLRDISFEPGLNRSLDFYLNMAYAIPAADCWSLSLLTHICLEEKLDGKSSNLVQELKFDIFPDTLAEFLANTSRSGGYALAWDPRFGPENDYDGDGLRRIGSGGLDPNDSLWDTDEDGLSDRFELERRALGESFDPALADTDADGLSDYQETVYDTNPARKDSDNDGLLDGQEVYHEVTSANDPACPTQEPGSWCGGWNLTISSTLVISVTSDPTRPDGDDDGIPDRVELLLAGSGFNPRIFNDNPLLIGIDVDDGDGFLRPGQTLAYTVTAQTSEALTQGALELNAQGPISLSSGLLPLNLTGLSETLVSGSSLITATTGVSVNIGATARVRLAQPPALPTWRMSAQTIAGAGAEGVGGVGVPFNPADVGLTLGPGATLFASLRSSSPGYGGVGDIVMSRSGGAQDYVLERYDTEPGGVITALRGAGRPDIACNSAGVCYVVYDEIDNCSTVRVPSLRVDIAGSDHGTSGIELLLYSEDVQGRRTLAWAGGNLIDIGSGQTVTQDLGSPIRYCNQTELILVESDGDSQQEIGRYTLVPYQPYTGSTTFEGNGHKVTASIVAEERQSYYAAYVRTGTSGAALNDTLSVRKLGQSQPISSSSLLDMADFRPVVASNGTNFVAVWERVRREVVGGSIQVYSELWARWFDSSGLLSGPESLIARQLLSNVNLAAPFVPRREFDLAWLGDRFRLVWSSDNFEVLATDLTVATQSGAVTRTATLIVDASALAINGGPRIAAGVRSSDMAIVYTRSSGGAFARFYSAAQPDGVLVSLGSNAGDARVAYHPARDGWLVAWVEGSSIRQRLYSLQGQVVATAGPTSWSPDASATVLWSKSDLVCYDTRMPPVSELRFEEVPAATSFADSAPSVDTAASCPGGSCPDAGAPGAAGAERSDFAARFDGTGSITLTNRARDTFTVAFWMRSTQTNTGIILGTDSWDVRLENGKLALRYLNIRATSSASFNDGAWHFVVATRDQASGTLRLFVNGSQVASNVGSTGVASNLPLTIGGQGFRGDLDNLQVYSFALPASLVQSLYNRTLDYPCTFAVGSRATTAETNTSVLRTNRLFLDAPLTSNAIISASTALSMVVDSDTPSVRILAPGSSAPVRGVGGLVVGGSANDPTSGVGQVEVRVNGGAWQPATGLETWTFALTGTEGVYNLEARVSDRVGNAGEDLDQRRVVIDNTPPQASLTTSTSMPIMPYREGDGRWIVRLAGSLADPKVGGYDGSGLATDLAEVLLEAPDIPEGPQGAGWQPARVLSNGNWEIFYTLPAALTDPTGNYTVRIRIPDQAGNYLPDGAPVGVIQLDVAAPEATLAANLTSTSLITASTPSVGGAIIERGGLAVNTGMEVAFVPADVVAARTGTVLELPFEEPDESGWFDDQSGEGNAARCDDPCPEPLAAGRVGRGLRFDNIHQLLIPHNSVVDMGQRESFTLQAWLKTNVTREPTAADIIVKQGPESRRYALGLTSNGRIVLTYGAASDQLSGGPDLRNDQWRQLVAVYDQTLGKAFLYVDGALVAEGALGGDPANTGDLLIGGAGNQRLGGDLDEVMIWDRALSSAEVAALRRGADQTWYAASLPQGGRDSTWAINLPAGLEGDYQIDLRTTDSAGNTAIVARQWRGIIDTTAPRIDFNGVRSGASYSAADGSQRFELHWNCDIRDRNLDPDQLRCRGQGDSLPQLSYFVDPVMQAFLPNRPLVAQAILNAASFETSATPVVSASACDRYGNCASVTPTLSGPIAPPPSGPAAAILSPSAGQVITADGGLTLTIAASAPTALRDAYLTVDGVAAGSLSFSQTENLTRTQRSLSLAIAGEGPRILGVQASDYLGNFSTPHTISVVVDRQPPTLTLDVDMLDNSHTPAPGSGVLLLDGTVTDTIGVAAVQLRIGDGPFEHASFAAGRWRASPTISNPVEGQLVTVTLRATDLAGRVTTLTRTYTYAVQLIAPPDTQITTVLSPYLNYAPTISFTAVAGGRPFARFECSLNERPFTTCTSPRFVSGDVGPNIFRVRAVDTAGVADLSPARVSWFSDSAWPIGVNFLEHPPEFLTGNSASFVLEGLDNPQGASGVERFRCEMNKRSLVTGSENLTPDCSTRFSLTNLEDATYILFAFPIDRAGNQGSQAWVRFSIDNTPPETTLYRNSPNLPLSLTNSISGSITYDGWDEQLAGQGTNNGMLRMECQLDNGPREVCPSQPSPVGLFGTRTFSGLSDGRHIFRVWAVAATGLVDPTPDVYEWTVDATPPETIISGGPATFTSSRTASFTLGSSDGPGSGLARLECRVGTSGAWTTCTSPFNVGTTLADGTYTFAARAVDRAANIDPTPAIVSWTVDTTAPTTSITSSPLSLTNATSATFGLAGGDERSGVARLECSFDGAPYAECADGVSFEGLADGTHTLLVRAVDQAGNPDATPASFSWTVNTVLPDTQITSVPPLATSSLSLTLTFQGIAGTGPAITGFECALDDAAFASCSSPLTLTSLAEGTRSLAVRARNAAGSLDAAPAIASWLIDRTAPETTLTASATGVTTASFGFSGNDGAGIGVAGFQCSLNNASFSDCSSGITYNGLSASPQIFRVRAVDGAGNADATPASLSWNPGLASNAPPVTALANQGQVTLSWLPDSQPGLAGYDLERRINGGAASLLASLPPTQTSYVDLVTPTSDLSITYQLRSRLINGVRSAPSLVTVQPRSPAAITFPNHGVLMIDAADYSFQQSRANLYWQQLVTTTLPTPLTVLPNQGRLIDANISRDSVAVGYPVHFTTPGTYTVWAQLFAPSGTDDSIHLGLNGAVQPEADRLSSARLKSWHWSSKTMDGPHATLVVTQTGVQTVTVWMREDGTIFNRLILVRNSSAAPARQVGSRVVVEAEAFDSWQASDRSYWQPVTVTLTGALGLGALPDQNRLHSSNSLRNSPQVSYHLVLTPTSTLPQTYYVWVRMWAPNGSGDSVHIGLNGQAQTASDNLKGTRTKAWHWTRATIDGPVAQLRVSAAGPVTLNLWMREDGVQIDRFLLTTDAAYVPTGSGPPASPR